MMWKDEIVEELRRARDEYAARFNYDIAAIMCRHSPTPTIEWT